jgi:subtilisin family serine protease
VAAGVTYVVAAGNESADVAEKAPATYSEVLTVAAMTDYDGIPGGRDPTNCFGDPAFADDKYAFFSNFATSAEDRAHTVAAPGVCVVSTVPLGTFLPEFDTNYGIDTGTSMATPHVAGVVAQCIVGGACTGKTPAQIIQKIVADAAAYNISNPTYGFIGDPQHPIAGKYYGNLIRAALY